VGGGGSDGSGDYLTVAEAARDLPAVPALSHRHTAAAASARMSLLAMAVPAPLRPAVPTTAAQVCHNDHRLAFPLIRSLVSTAADPLESNLRHADGCRESLCDNME
jgi:hypothetical protein